MRPRPDELVLLRDAFERWRRERKRGERIPEDLWRAAARLAVDRGVSPVATALRLDYYSLARRRDAGGGSSSFVEVALPGLNGAVGQSVIELEDAERGARLRIVLSGGSAADVAAVARVLWSGEPCCR
jgi:ferric-dicitrate binding protein FerR (iron transport regulator)